MVVLLPLFLIMILVHLSQHMLDRPEQFCVWLLAQLLAETYVAPHHGLQRGPLRRSTPKRPFKDLERVLFAASPLQSLGVAGG